MSAANGIQQPAKRVPLVLTVMFAAIGVVPIVIAQWENFHNADGHSYWPFIDLFALFLVGCGFVVFAIHPLVWRSILTRAASVSKSRVTLGAILLDVTSIPATVVVALVVGFIASVLPR